MTTCAHTGAAREPARPSLPNEGRVRPALRSSSEAERALIGAGFAAVHARAHPEEPRPSCTSG